MKRKHTRIIAYILAGVIGAAALAGCSGQSAFADNAMSSSTGGPIPKGMGLLCL